MAKKSRKKTVNNEIRALVIATLLFVFLVPVGMLVVITIRDDHAQDNFTTEVDDVMNTSENETESSETSTDMESEQSTDEEPTEAAPMDETQTPTE